MQSFVKMMVIFFGTMFLLKLFFGGHRHKVDPIDEYMYYQMQNDPSLH